jgi:hypothetical protein
MNVATLLRRTAFVLFGVFSAHAQPVPIALTDTNDPPPSYTLAWSPGTGAPTNAVAVAGFVVQTNGVIVADTQATNVTIEWPVGRLITNAVAAYGLSGTNRLTSAPATLVWTNIFWQKPTTNVLTFSALSSPTKPTNLRLGNNVPNWQPFSLTNPTGNGTTLFWVPLKGTNAQAIQCRTGAIGTNLFTDGVGLGRWPAFIGSGYYWVVLTTTNL